MKTRKKVLVTGGVQRIGRVIVETFAAPGNTLLVHYNSQPRKTVRTLVQKLEKQGAQVLTYKADLSRMVEVRRLARAVTQDVGALDVLVNNASVFYPTPLKTVTEKQWDQILAVNLKAPFFLSQTLGLAMKRRGGCIINLADWSPAKPYREFLPYCISKGGVMTLTRGLARELAPRVRVNAVCPGPILPPSFRTARKARAIGEKTLLKRWGDPQDIAKMVAFLVNEAAYSTGQFFYVDGGESLR